MTSNKIFFGESSFSSAGRTSVSMELAGVTLRSVFSPPSGDCCEDAEDASGVCAGDGVEEAGFGA
jgi:hypothetical protein